MHFSFSRGERKVSELVRRLFSGKGSAKAERALRSANPHVDFDHLDQVDEGTPIVVPTVEGLETAGDVHPLQAATAVAALEAVRAGLAGLAETVDADAAAIEESARATLMRLKDPELKAAASEDAELKAHLPKVVRDAEAEVERARAMRNEQQQVAAQAEADIAALLEVLR